MRVLIFGGSGFLGTELGQLLKASGYTVKTVSRSHPSSDYNFDIAHFASFEQLSVDAFDFVINCATILPGGDYLDNDYLNKIYSTNILGSQNICKWLSGQNSVRKIINCSTLVVVGKPWPLNLTEDHSSPPVGKHVLYASSKLTQELIFETFANDHGVPLTQIRFSALYGKNMPWNGVICSLIDQAEEKAKITLTNATKVSADFLYITDAARIVLAALNSKIGGIINGASGVETTILQIAKVIQSVSQSPVEIENSDDDDFVPNRALISTAKLGTIVDPASFVSFEEGVIKLMDR